MATLALPLSPRTERPARSDHILALDGVRGLAILSVVVFHCSRILPPSGSPFAHGLAAVLSPGWSGVDLFFVLSGFLITGILLDARGEGEGTPDGYYRSFWARRSLRIVPLYALYLLFALHLAPMAAPKPSSPLWHWLYASNFLFSIRPDAAVGGRTSHLWSLAVEEQFYIVWPIVIAVLPRRRLTQLCWAILVAAPLLRLVLALLGGNNAAQKMMPARADTLVVGALLALAMRGASKSDTPWVARFALPAGVAIAVLFAVQGGLSSGNVAVEVIGLSALAALYGAFVWRAVQAKPRGTLWSVLTSPVLRQAGKYSYAMYLVNSVVVRPIADLVFPGETQLPLLAFLVFTALVLAATVGIAVVTWYAWERPWQSLKRFAPMPKREGVAH